MLCATSTFPKLVERLWSKADPVLSRDALRNIGISEHSLGASINEN